MTEKSTNIGIITLTIKSTGSRKLHTASYNSHFSINSRMMNTLKIEGLSL